MVIQLPLISLVFFVWINEKTKEPPRHCKLMQLRPLSISTLLLSKIQILCFFKSKIVVGFCEGKKIMGNASSMLTQYEIEEVQHHCNCIFSQQEIVSLYERFCLLDRNAKGFISADEFLSVPEFAVNPHSHRLLSLVDGLNFKDFVAFLAAFGTRANLIQKIELIFRVCDSDCKGKVIFSDILEVLRDVTGSFMSENQREQVLTHVLEEAGYRGGCSMLLDDFVKILENSNLKMKVEVPAD